MMNKTINSQYSPQFAGQLFGVMPNGESIFLYELTNSNGVQLKVTNYGATITSLKIPINTEEIVDVVLGFDTLEAYQESFLLKGSPYFGATVGRFAGRINKGTFILNSDTIYLNINNNQNTLHGGNVGFSEKVWEVQKINLEKNPSITLAYLSPDGEENFPGDLSVEITYTLTEENELVIEYKAITTKDTLVNLTHHSYFNLAGHGSSVSDQKLFINSNKILEITSDGIPTGQFLSLENHAFDFRIPKKCPEAIDNTFVLNENTDLAATLYNDANQLRMTVHTNQPGVHIYIGGDCGDLLGKERISYHSLSGICFETQNFPDAPNHINFPNSIVKAGDTYHAKTSYKFDVLS